METKKSDRVNLEKKRSMFFQMGLLLALGVVFVAFEWRVAPRLSNVAWDSPAPLVDAPIDMIRTFPEPPPPPPQVSLDLAIVDHTVDIGDMPHIIFDVEAIGENILSTGIFTQTAIVIDDEPEIFNSALVEVQPTFNGKPVEEAFRDYISQNLRYPQIAIDHGISGKVFVQFVVDTNGNVTDVQVMRSADALLDNEALRLIKSTSGLWTPGKQRNKPVRVRYTFPITFRLQ